MPTWKKDKEPAVKRKIQPMVRDLQAASGHVAFSKVILAPFTTGFIFLQLAEINSILC